MFKRYSEKLKMFNANIFGCGAYYFASMKDILCVYNLRQNVKPNN